MRSAKPKLRRRRLPHLLGIGVSAVAIAGLFQLQSVWAQADAEADEEPMAQLEAEELRAELEEEAREIEASAEAHGSLAAAEAAMPKVETGSAAALDPAAFVAEAEAAKAAEAKAPVVLAKAEVAVDTTVETETEATALPEVAALVAVPDLSGMSLRKARKTLKALGLKMSARDGSYRIPWDEWSYYKVRKQKTEPGTMVEAGTRIRIKAREKYRSYGKGY